MLTGFAVMRKNSLEELVEKFEVKQELGNGLVKYEYYGKEKLASKPKWNSVFYSKDSILGGDIFDLSSHSKSNRFPRSESLEYLIDMTDHVVVKIELDDEDVYGTDLVMTLIGHCGTTKQALDLMDKYDPSKNFKIAFNTSINFLLSVIFSEENLDRSITMRSSRLYTYVNKLLVENPDELDMSLYNVNIENLKKIDSVDARSLIFQAFKECIKDEELINKLAVIQIEYLMNIALKHNNVNGSLIESLEGISDDNKIKIVDDVVSVIPSKEKDYLFTIFKDEFINNHPKLFLDALYSSRYTYRIIEFFTTNKNLIDIHKIDKKRFVRASSLKKYNELAQYEADPQITYLSDIINSAGTILSERILIVACFTNNYSEEEFKTIDINPLADAIVSKLISRFTYELGTDICSILGDRTDNMQYLCDKVVERMCETGVNTMSRVRLIRDNASNRYKDSIFAFLNKSLEKSEDTKILRAIMKIDI